jgi:hypothetical protein
LAPSPQFPGTCGPACNLDTIRNGKERIDIVKFDIEGHETKF